MARRSDLFARLSLDYADHPKIAGLSDAAFRAHVEMILYSRRYLTDGRIAKQIAKRWPELAISELLANDEESPSLDLAENGDYLIHGYGEMQETRSEVEHKRRVRAESGRLGGIAKGKQSAKRSPSKLLSKNVPETETETEVLTSEVADATDRPEVVEILDYLDAKILETDPERKLPSRSKKNTDAARLLLDKDNRTVQQVKAAIKFSQDDEFWRSNILSMSKLREKYEQLRLKAMQSGAMERPTTEDRYANYPRAPRKEA